MNQKFRDLVASLEPKYRALLEMEPVRFGALPALREAANISGHGPRSPARDRTITWVKQLGRRWSTAHR